jgi:hypothetical protein
MRGGRLQMSRPASLATPRSCSQLQADGGDPERRVGAQEGATRCGAAGSSTGPQAPARDSKKQYTVHGHCTCKVWWSPCTVQALLSRRRHSPAELLLALGRRIRLLELHYGRPPGAPVQALLRKPHPHDGAMLAARALQVRICGPPLQAGDVDRRPRLRALFDVLLYAAQLRGRAGQLPVCRGVAACILLPFAPGYCLLPCRASGEDCSLPGARLAPRTAHFQRPAPP